MHDRSPTNQLGVPGDLTPQSHGSSGRLGRRNKGEMQLAVPVGSLWGRKLKTNGLAVAPDIHIYCVIEGWAVQSIIVLRVSDTADGVIFWLKLISLQDFSSNFS